jgi:molecular chaperone DnaK (HSP70)
VATADRGNYPVVDFVDHDGDKVGAIPSLIAARDGELRYGFDAAAVALDPAFTVLPSFKRLFSDPEARAARPVRIGETVVPLGELLTGFLEYVRDEVLKRSTAGRRQKAHGALEAAIAVPANALGAQRLLTLDAFRRAGFEVGALLNEPSAAGFEFTHRHRDALSSRRDLVVVYDLGGGTFDASAVRMTAHTHEVLASSGMSRLGGDDFDEVLARTALLSVDLELAALPSRARRALLAQCRDAKERIHPTSRKIVLDLDAALGRLAPASEVVLKVADYYAACQPLVEHTIDAMLPVMTRFEEEARAPDLAEVAGIYVVGGGSELPIVTRTLRERFGRRVHRSPHASAAVAIGLALAADRAADFSLVDRYAHTFGVFREGDAGREIICDPIFAPDTALPSPASAPITRTREYRAAHNVGHYRFFECSAVDGSGKPKGDMTVFGEVHFPFDPRLAADPAAVPVERRAGEGPRIEERYQLDERGMVEVIIRNLDAGYERAFRIGIES